MHGWLMVEGRGCQFYQGILHSDAEPSKWEHVLVGNIYVQVRRLKDGACLQDG